MCSFETLGHWFNIFLNSSIWHAVLGAFIAGVLMSNFRSKCKIVSMVSWIKFSVIVLSVEVSKCWVLTLPLFCHRSCQDNKSENTVLECWSSAELFWVFCGISGPDGYWRPRDCKKERGVMSGNPRVDKEAFGRRLKRLVNSFTVKDENNEVVILAD